VYPETVIVVLSPEQTEVKVAVAVPPTETALTVTAPETELTHLPVAEAVAVIEFPLAKVRPVFVHAPELTVVVPCETPPLYTVIVVPFASVLVPLTDVAPSQIGEFTTGVAEVLGAVSVTGLLP